MPFMRIASFFSSITNPNQFGRKNRIMNVLSSYSLGRNPNQRSGLEDLLLQLQRGYSSSSDPNQGGGEKQRDFFTNVLNLNQIGGERKNKNEKNFFTNVLNPNQGGGVTKKRKKLRCSIQIGGKRVNFTVFREGKIPLDGNYVALEKCEIHEDDWPENPGKDFVAKPDKHTPLDQMLKSVGKFREGDKGTEWHRTVSKDRFIEI